MTKSKNIHEFAKCEACDKLVPIVMKLNDGEVIYNICNNCLLLLVTVSLDKERFNNLLKNGHTVNEFYLHEDFYDSNGNALQHV